MARKTRDKYPEAIYHIMCRSESEFLLFRDDGDKDRYLFLLKKYTENFKCSIYAYCLMDNHLHLHFDPRGFDVSKFMHCLNTAYVRYYNHKYARVGHVFQGRFESRILDTSEYNLTVSAYIHNNPHDIEGFTGKEETYRYSSYGIYLGLVKDIYELVDKEFIMGIFNLHDPQKFSERYFSFVSHQRDIGSFKEMKKNLSSAIDYEYISGRKIILRDLPPSKVISYVYNRLAALGKDYGNGLNRRLSEVRAVATYMLRVLCGISYREICNNLYNVTISGCSKLFNRGHDLISRENSIYSFLIDELVQSHV